MRTRGGGAAAPKAPPPSLHWKGRGGRGNPGPAGPFTPTGAWGDGRRPGCQQPHEHKRYPPPQAVASEATRGWWISRGGAYIFLPGEPRPEYTPPRFIHQPRVASEARAACRWWISLAPVGEATVRWFLATVAARFIKTVAGSLGWHVHVSWASVRSTS